MAKRIIFDIGHPAQVHHFKNIYWNLQKKGWEGLFVAKEKEISIELLEKLKLPYKIIGKNEKGLLRKILKIPQELINFYRIVNSFKSDFVLCRFSIHSTFISKIKGIKCIGFADTEHTKLIDSITTPLVNYKITANSYNKDLGKNHFRYSANIELFYLHPEIYNPDPSVLDTLDILKNEKYVILRFVSWNAHHDVGYTGINFDQKIKLVKELNKYAKVFISSEEQLPQELEQYKINISVDKMHDVIAFADLYIGEGGSMASEAACLGTPSIYVNNLNMGYLIEEERFGLLYSFRNSIGVMEKAIELLKDNHAKEKSLVKLNNFIKGKIDVTSYMVWFIENYPNSLKIIKENPDYQYNFK